MNPTAPHMEECRSPNLRIKETSWPSLHNLIGNAEAKLTRKLASVVITVGLLVGVSGCSQVAVAPQGDCSPEYSVGGAEGGLHVQQARKGAAIAWGIYVAPEYKVGMSWTVGVYAGGVKIDGKRQGYEPHGSISAARAAKYSGKTLEISGTAVRNRDDVLTFSGKCTIA